MKFCSDCGSANLALSVPEGDNRPRFSCPDCQAVHYQNPNIVCGVLPLWQGKVLLCKRAIEPRLGKWTLPAGFMENGESVSEGAARETLEEACATVCNMQLLSMISVPQINQVHIYFVADLTDGHFDISSESLAVELYAIDDIPWSEIAFPTVSHTLKHWLNQWRVGDSSVLIKELRR
jgi:ADP-ribose pyrophosphatase YjhB (NUDIX family)